MQTPNETQTNLSSHGLSATTESCTSNKNIPRRGHFDPTETYSSDRIRKRLEDWSVEMESEYGSEGLSLIDFMLMGVETRIISEPTFDTVVNSISTDKNSLSAVVQFKCPRTYATRRVVRQLISIDVSAYNPTILSIQRRRKDPYGIIEFLSPHYVSIILRHQQIAPFPFELTLSQTYAPQLIPPFVENWVADGTSIHIRIEISNEDKAEILRQYRANNLPHHPPKADDGPHQSLPKKREAGDTQQQMAPDTSDFEYRARDKIDEGKVINKVKSSNFPSLISLVSSADRI